MIGVSECAVFSLQSLIRLSRQLLNLKPRLSDSCTDRIFFSLVGVVDVMATVWEQAQLKVWFKPLFAVFTQPVPILCKLLICM